MPLVDALSLGTGSRHPVRRRVASREQRTRLRRVHLANGETRIAARAVRIGGLVTSRTTAQLAGASSNASFADAELVASMSRGARYTRPRSHRFRRIAGALPASLTQFNSGPGGVQWEMSGAEKCPEPALERCIQSVVDRRLRTRDALHDNH